ncbi:MAG: division/cell wall cluster transcriptional repressor MraZ [Planctomycetaceae bacterium]|jgi:MraZ protein|nr:division/cell wall cluster transcriptional repressor MraZ [Planctomycetaceae bacterium]
MADIKLIEGEFSRKLDDRFRLSLPDELNEVFTPNEGNCVIVKERAGCLSLWEQSKWDAEMTTRKTILESKLNLQGYSKNISEIQTIGRLMSTRSRPVQLADKRRLLIPEGFREFLGVEAKGGVMVVGAAICIEIWHPEKFITYIEGQMPEFRALLENLTN